MQRTLIYIELESILAGQHDIRDVVTTLVNRTYKRKVDFFKDTGIDKATYSRLCSGVRKFSPKICKKIAPALKIQPETLAMAAAYMEVKNGN